MLDIEKAEHVTQQVDYRELVKLYYNSPISYFSDVLSFDCDKKQRQLALSVRDNKRTSVRAGQGTGKTAVAACVVIWYLHMRYKSRTIITAPTAQQLNIVFWAEIAKWLKGSYAENDLEQLKTRINRRGFDLEWFAQAKVAKKRENMLGSHTEHLLVVCEEASGIDDEILEVLLGTISDASNRILFLGNPTRNTGLFYDSHNILRDDFKCIHIDAEKCSRTDKEQHRILAKKYGRASNVYRVFVKGEFPVDEDDVFHTMNDVMGAVEREKVPIVAQDTVIDIGVDVARFGDDKTVIMYREDGIVKIHKDYNGKDTMQTVGETLALAKLIREHRPDSRVVIKVDDTGVGGGVTDRLNQLIRSSDGLSWLEVVRVVFGKPIRHKRLYDTTTYMASILQGLMRAGEIIIPNDTDLIGQLTTRKYGITDKGKIKLESKKEMKKRKLASPDYADALYLTILPTNIK